MDKSASPAAGADDGDDVEEDPVAIDEHEAVRERETKRRST